MPQSLAQVHIHLVFSTKSRHPYLSDAVCPALHAYLATVLKNMGCHSISLGSVEDHIHVLFGLSRTIALSKVVETLKTSSSKWMKKQDVRLKHFAWQSGYGAFSVCASHVQTVRSYIGRQRDHHRKESFKDEFRALLRDYDIAYDERYVWD